MCRCRRSKTTTCWCASARAASAAATCTATTDPPAAASRRSSWGTRRQARSNGSVAAYAASTQGDRVTFDSTVSCGACEYCRAARRTSATTARVLGVSCADYRRHGAFAEFVSVPAPDSSRLPRRHAVRARGTGRSGVGRRSRRQPRGPAAGRHRCRDRLRHDRAAHDPGVAAQRVHADRSPSTIDERRRALATKFGAAATIQPASRVRSRRRARSDGVPRRGSRLRGRRALRDRRRRRALPCVRAAPSRSSATWPRTSICRCRRS